MKRRFPLAFLFASAVSFGTTSAADHGPGWVRYEGGEEGPGKGRHIVLISGDEEYRSEEALPLLGQILSQHHGFTCTVLFSIDDDGTINPDRGESVGNSEALDSADALVIALRFRKWPDEDMARFDAAIQRGVPVVGLRTSTHAFQLPGESGFRQYNAFGKNVLGEGWISHWGRHKAEATRGVIEPGQEEHPILRGVEDVFGDTDVYEVYPPEDSTILMRGQVLAGMSPDDEPASYEKTRASDRGTQDVNDPMMPISWTRVVPNASGGSNRIVCHTMGAATDLASEDFRRMVVNSVFWSLDLEVPERADVTPIGDFEPSAYDFGGYKRGVSAADHALPAEG